jgi:hypothetical protein
MRGKYIEWSLIIIILIIVPTTLIVSGITLHKLNSLKFEPDTVKILVYPPVEPDTIHLERATTYQPSTSQCDSDPLTTADGSKIDPSNMKRWVALSRDLLARWGGQFAYGDTITIYSESHPNLNGDWEVHDCMNARYKMSIDFLMATEDNVPKLGVGKDVKIIYCGE